jgi:hypothetical protein
MQQTSFVSALVLHVLSYELAQRLLLKLPLRSRL